MNRYIPKEMCPCEEGYGAHFAYSESIPVENTLLQRDQVVQTPEYGIQQGAPMDFIFLPYENDFMDMASLHGEVTFRITKENKHVKDSDPVSVCNNMFDSLFKSIETRVNDHLLSSSSGEMYFIKAYMHNILTLEPENPGLEAMGLFPYDEDTSLYFDLKKNKNFKRAHNIIAKGEDVTVSGPLVLDIAGINNYLAPGNKVALRATTINKDFFINATKTSPPVNWGLEVTSVKIFLDYIRVMPEKLFLLLSPGREQVYLTNHTDITPIQVAKGTRYLHHILVSQSHLPKFLVIGIMQTSALAGNDNQEGLYFRNKFVSSIQVTVNGTEYPSLPMHPKSNRAYYHLLMNTGRTATRASSFITPGNFKKGYSLRVYDFTPDGCGMSHTHIGKMGDLSLDIEWSENTDDHFTVLCMMTHHQIIKINPTTNQVTTKVF